MNAGLQDAGHLARALTQALADPGSAAASLASYEARRAEEFDGKVRVLTDGIERMETASAALRRLGFSALGLVRAFGLERVIARKLSMLDA